MDRRITRVIILLVFLVLGLLGLRLYFTSLWLNASVTFQNLVSNAISVPPRLRHPEVANATLGFGAVYAVSGASMKEQLRLLETSKTSQMDIRVLDTQDASASDIKTFRKASENRVSEGDAVSWLHQRATLQSFNQSRLATALIVGRDTDWPSDLRTARIPVAAATVQKLTENQVGFASQLSDQPCLRSYWGIEDSWDLLNLGDCGELSGTSEWKSTGQQFVSPGDELSPRAISGKVSSSNPRKRILRTRADPPMCASAYAVTRKSAQRLLELLEDGQGKSQATNYDERMTEICRDSLFRCLSISPRMLHRIHARSEGGEVG